MARNLFCKTYIHIWMPHLICKVYLYSRLTWTECRPPASLCPGPGTPSLVCTPPPPPRRSCTRPQGQRPARMGCWSAEAGYPATWAASLNDQKKMTTFKEELEIRSLKPDKPVEIRRLSNHKCFIFSSSLASQNLTGHKSEGSGRIILMDMEVIGSCYWSRNNYVRQTCYNMGRHLKTTHFHFLSLNLRSWQFMTWIITPSFVIAISFPKYLQQWTHMFYMQKILWCPPKYFMIHLLKVKSRDGEITFKIVEW